MLFLCMPFRAIQVEQRAAIEAARRAEDVEIKAYFQERTKEVSRVKGLALNTSGLRVSECFRSVGDHD